MNITFIQDHILVKRLPIPEATTGNIILPTRAVELSQLGRIVNMGPKRNHEGLKPGDLVLVPKFGGILYPIHDTDYYLYHNKEILAVIEGV